MITTTRPKHRTRTRSMPWAIALALLTVVAVPAGAIYDDQAALSPPFPDASENTRVAISPDGRFAVFLADLVSDGQYELFSVRLDGSDDRPVRLNAPSSTNSRILRDFEIAPDSSRVVHRASLTTIGKTELYSAPIGVADGQIRLSSTAHEEGDVQGRSDNFQITPDSLRVVYLGDLTSDEVVELYSAPIGTAGGQIRLSTTAHTEGDVRSSSGVFQIAPDSGRVVYLGDLATEGVRELFSAPVDKNGSQIRLHGDAAASGGVDFDFAIAPDASRVVFTGELTTDALTELYSAPLDVAEGAIPLSSTAHPHGDVDPGADFRIAPDSRHVVYVGDLTSDTTDELYSAPIDAAGGQVRLSSAPAGNDVSTTFEIAPDSRHVVYHGALVSSDHAELFRAPIDGSADQIRLRTGPADVGEVRSSDFRISPDGSRVVYRGDLTTEDVPELYSAPIDTPGEQVRLNTAPPAGGSVFESFTIAPDSSFVVYVGDVLDDGDVQVFASGRGQLPARSVVALAALDTTGTTVTLTWDRPPFGSRITGYEVAATTDRRTTRRLTVDGDTTTATLTGLPPDTAHTATVVAVNDDVDTVLIATGTNFPDALAGGPLATTLGAPILLVEPGALPDATRTALTTLDPDTVIALGGTLAVGGDAVLQPPVLTAAATAAGNATTTRLAGNDRYATGTAIATTLDTPDTVYVAVGTNFPDALTGGPAAAAEAAPVVLVAGGTDIIPGATLEYLRALPDLRRIVLIGGDAVITPAVADQLAQLLD